MTSGRLDPSESDLAAALAQSIETHAPLPEVPRRFTLDDAYAIQHRVTALRCPHGAGGIKAGVTAERLQRLLGIDHALLGSLYGDARLAPGAVIAPLEGRLVECELAVVVDGAGEPTAVAPAIEIASVRLARPEDLSAASLVLCNVGADAYIVGDLLPWSPPYDGASVTLMRDGEVLDTAPLSDALGGPERATPWIWDEAIRRGFAADGETLLLTGACGKPVPAAPGRYSADFGALGELQFEVDGNAAGS